MMALEDVVYRIKNDQQFAESFFSDPNGALEKAGLELEESELDALLDAITRVGFADGPLRNWFVSQFGSAAVGGRNWFVTQLHKTTT
jgi:hypothetical protein